MKFKTKIVIKSGKIFSIDDISNLTDFINNKFKNKEIIDVYSERKLLDEMVNKFTWIIKGKIAASNWPEPQMFENYRKEGIKVIINATNFDNIKNVSNEFTYYQIGIPNFSIPSDSQIKQLLEITNKHNIKNEPIVVHCVAGCGRTGLLVTIWAIHNGYIPKDADPVKWIREKRKCCIETKEQIELVRKIAKKYHNIQ